MKKDKPPVKTSPDDLLGRKDVCAILGICPKTYFNYTHWYKDNPPLLSSVMTRGRRKVRRGVIDYFLKSRETKGQY